VKRTQHRVTRTSLAPQVGYVTIYVHTHTHQTRSVLISGTGACQASNNGPCRCTSIKDDRRHAMLAKWLTKARAKIERKTKETCIDHPSHCTHTEMAIKNKTSYVEPDVGPNLFENNPSRRFLILLPVLRTFRPVYSSNSSIWSDTECGPIRSFARMHGNHVAKPFVRCICYFCFRSSILCVSVRRQDLYYSLTFDELSAALSGN
jgi:hypothetical protein